jgi:CDGSH-type Zn-finger protein
VDDSPRIEIEAGGPYRVHGDLPLTEMAPVHTFNGEPVAWHTLCRCGRSATLPFCDESHVGEGFAGAETADRRRFDERAEIVRQGDHAFADDATLCAGAGFCGTRTTNAWDMLADADDPERDAALRGMVWCCPSGRLVLLGADGAALEPDLEPGLAVIPGGPLWVRGRVTITSADGTRWETRNRVTLCRCGQSQNTPFCDGSHESAHFDER